MYTKWIGLHSDDVIVSAFYMTLRSGSGVKYLKAHITSPHLVSFYSCSGTGRRHHKSAAVAVKFKVTVLGDFK